MDITLTEEGWALRERAAGVPEKVRCRYGIEYDEYVTLLEHLKKLIERLV